MQTSVAWGQCVFGSNRELPELHSGAYNFNFNLNITDLARVLYPVVTRFENIVIHYNEPNHFDFKMDYNPAIPAVHCLQVLWNSVAM